MRKMAAGAFENRNSTNKLYILYNLVLPMDIGDMIPADDSVRLLIVVLKRWITANYTPRTPALEESKGSLHGKGQRKNTAATSAGDSRKLPCPPETI
jgi:hypothetical protein